jgi:hypothetical protein
MFKILPFLFLLGCNRSPLSPDLEEIVLDYQYWAEDNVERIQERLNLWDDWHHNVSKLDDQSWDSEYYEREIHREKKEATAGLAHPKNEKIFIVTTHPLWKYIRRDYADNKESWEDCDDLGDGVEHGWQSANAVFVLCHENAHVLGIKPHDDVYDLGFVCKDLRTQEINDWLSDCQGEVE